MAKNLDWPANACFYMWRRGTHLVKVPEELLIEDKGHTTDLLHSRLCLRVTVQKVGGDGNSQLATELLTAKPCNIVRPKSTLIDSVSNGSQILIYILFMFWYNLNNNKKSLVLCNTKCL